MVMYNSNPTGHPRLRGLGGSALGVQGLSVQGFRLQVSRGLGFSVWCTCAEAGLRCSCLLEGM